MFVRWDALVRTNLNRKDALILAGVFGVGNNVDSGFINRHMVLIRDAEIADVPFLAALAGCSARRAERHVAGHTSEVQRRNAPVSAAIKGTSAVSASLRGR